jgi:hypothetical protein
MLRFKSVSAVLLPLVLAACGASRSPVPVVGTSNDLSPLAGDWAGDYSSAESGRRGSISFSLRAATDSAFGDVTMIPAGLGRPLQPWRGGENITGAVQVAPSTTLTIRFVRIEAGHVSGTLDPYADPQTGARLLTTFSGELKGNTITGGYTTRLPSGETQSGRWSVQRR